MEKEYRKPNIRHFCSGLLQGSTTSSYFLLCRKLNRANGKMMKTYTFKGTNVFMSRKLVPPEIYDALKVNGAEVFPCSDPSRNSPNDYYFILSPDHEKFEDLRAKVRSVFFHVPKNTNNSLSKVSLVTLQWMVLRCLASGFDMDEKVKLEKLVKAMGGLLCSKPTMDVSFVIVKDVLAAKYKWALDILKKPILTASSLYSPRLSITLFPTSHIGFFLFLD